LPGQSPASYLASSLERAFESTIPQLLSRTINSTIPCDGGVDSEGDPRVSFRVVVDGDGSLVVGGDNRRPLWYSQKYASRSTDIPMAKGTEMRLIEAEAQLQGGQVQGAVSLISNVRAYHGLDPVSATSRTQAWDLLIRERGVELWLEGR